MSRRKSGREPQVRARAEERWLTWGMLALVCGAFFVFSLAFLPRLTNVNFGDIEFTGWSGPLGDRILRGDRPYVDFVLPIPPGSFLVLAAIQAVMGRALLLQELWLDAIIHMGMGVMAYAIASRFTSRTNALFVAAATLLTIVQLNKECAYDHTAQLVAWASVTAGSFAFFSVHPKRRRRLWTLAGGLAGATLLFKQSTAVGILAGWIGALSYLAAAETLSRQRAASRAWLSDLAHWAKGAAWGLFFVWAVLVLLGSTLTAFFQATFVDGSTLKGGAGFLAQHLASYLLAYPAFLGSLGTIVGFVLVGMRLLNKRGQLHLGDEPSRAEPSGPLLPLLTGILTAAAFGAGAAILWSGVSPFPVTAVMILDRFKQVPPLGLVFLAAFFVAHLVRIDGGGPISDLTADPRRTGHVFNALILVAFGVSLLHNTSAPEFRPFYDNNAIIPVAFLGMFVALDRARLQWLSVVALFCVAVSLFGNKYYRAMRATIPVGRTGHWAGMKVSDRGATMVEAALRVRRLTRPDDTVLVLPEDVAFAQLIDRERPHLLGAIVFVDQYPPRLASDDIARLAEDPPDVIVLHPRRPYRWQRFFRIWSGESGAEHVIQFVIRDLIPARYTLDRSYTTQFLWNDATLDIYVRSDLAQKRTDEGRGAESAKTNQ